MAMNYEPQACAPANVLEHADSVFNSAILLSQQVRAIVDHLCGAVQESVGSKQDPSYASAFGHLRNRAGDALVCIAEAREALPRLEDDVGYHGASIAKGDLSQARFAG